MRPEPFNLIIKHSVLPKAVGTVIDIAPVIGANRSLWMLLEEQGGIFRFDADTGEFEKVAHSTLEPEPVTDSLFPPVRQRLHVSSRGEFVAVVNDYARYGQIIDTTSGEVTLSLDGGDCDPETVPLSFAFADHDSRVIAIHRTAWNRLDFSDPATGKLLSERGPTSYQYGEEQPENYLDYFHGALHVSPTSTQILDDGWVWHPVGEPVVWSLEQWFSENVWESESGPSKKAVCSRAYYWDKGMTWLDETRVAIGGLGDHDDEIIAGARVFDVTKPAVEGVLANGVGPR